MGLFGSKKNKYTNIYVLYFAEPPVEADAIVNWMDRSDWDIDQNTVLFKNLPSSLAICAVSAKPINLSSDLSSDKWNITGKGSFATDLAIQCKINEFHIYDIVNRLSYKFTYYFNFGSPNQERAMFIDKSEFDEAKWLELAQIVSDETWDGQLSW